MCGFLELKLPHNYLSSIHSFHHLSRNLLACIWQYNHLTDKPEFRFTFASEVKKIAFKFSSLKVKEQYFITYSSPLAQMYQPLTIFAANLENRDYKKRINLIEEYKTKFMQMGSESDDTTFVGCCVQLSHGFQSQADYDYFLTLYHECKALVDKYKTKQIAESFSLIVSQMLRNISTKDYAIYSNNSNDDMLLNDSISLSIDYPNEEEGILERTVHEFSSRYKKMIDNQNYTQSKKYIDNAINIISKTAHIEYSDQKKIWPGELVIAGLMDYVNNAAPLAMTEQVLDLIYKTSYFALDQSVSQITAEIFNIAQRAKNEGDIDVIERCKECLLFIKPYLEERHANSIDQYVGHL